MSRPDKIKCPKQKKSLEKCRNMLLTLNNPQVPAEEWLSKLFTDSECVYLCGQLEKGSNGTIHIQAFINFKEPQRFSKIHKYDKRVACVKVNINNGAHDYCMKTDTRMEGPWEYGIKPVQRNNKIDWESVYENARTNNFDRIPAEIKVRSYSNLKQIAKDNMEITQKDDLRGVWIYGPAGCGKSSLAKAKYPNAYPKNRNQWWDGYKGEEAVIMDDMDPFCKELGGSIKDWMDRYGTILQTKGGAVVDKYKVFIVTSQYSIDEIWEDQATRDAIKRRCKIIEFKNDGTVEQIERPVPKKWDFDLNNINI